jgi:predicted ester cyclase
MVRLTLTGTNQGEFQGRPPTGKRVAQPQMHVFRLFEGKMVEHWEVRDDLSMMQQLGVVPAHGQ